MGFIICKSGSNTIFFEVNAMDKDNNIEKLKNRIWTTRVSRVNTEKRLQQKESFIQAINIYYSCVTSIFSIMSCINNDEKLSIITVYMTISLLVSIMYLSSQKYGEKAQQYKENYISLNKLEFKLEHCDENDIEQIEEQYCDLLNDYSNHTTFDYYRTLKESSSSFQEEKNWSKFKMNYYWGVIWRTTIKILIIVLPFLLYFSRGEF